MAYNCSNSKKALADDNEQNYHIFNHTMFTFCMVCKEILTDNSTVTRNILVLSHLNSSKHRESIRTLFKMCIPDPLCDSPNLKYADIVDNSVFDMSMLLCNEPSYVCKQGENYVCLICQKNISKVTDYVTVIINNLVCHLQSELHLNNIKENVNWVYCLNENVDFLMFHKTVVYCSVCKQSLHSDENTLLQAVIDHLQTDLRKHHRDPDNRKEEVSCSEENVCRELESLNITDDDLSTVESDLSSQPRENEESFEELHDFCEDEALTCPECGEFIEIYNENVDFSMQLHSQKHKDLSNVHNNITINYQDDTDYVCPICQEIIPIFNRNIELSISRHFEERQHDHESFSVTETNCGNEFDFLDNVFAQLPDDLKKNRNFFNMDGNDVFCKLCNCSVLSDSDLTVVCNKLSDHFLDCYHAEQYKLLNQHLTSAVVDYNEQTRGRCVAEEQNNLFDMLVSRHQIIRNNKQFVEKRMVNYFCNLCKKHICFSPNIDTLRLNFALHFKGHVHKTLKRSRKKTKKTNQISTLTPKKDTQPKFTRNKIMVETLEEIIEETSKQFLGVYLNKNYIKVKDGNLFCEVCQTSIIFTKSGIRILSHCYSSSHNRILIRNADQYIAELKNTKFSTQKNTESFQVVLNKLAKKNIFKPHIVYIKSRGRNFCCCLCNVVIPFSECGKHVRGHFTSYNHIMKTYRVNCKEDSKIINDHSQTINEISKKGECLSNYNVNNQTSSQHVAYCDISKTKEEQKSDIKKLNQKANKVISILSIHNPKFKSNRHHFEVRNGSFFCKLCKESVVCTNRKYLKNHLKKEAHCT